MKRVHTAPFPRKKGGFAIFTLNTHTHPHNKKTHVRTQTPSERSGMLVGLCVCVCVCVFGSSMIREHFDFNGVEWGRRGGSA